MPQKLFLASSLNKTLPKLSDLANLNPVKTKVVFIQDAAIPYGNPDQLFWIKQDKKAFLKLGYQLEVINLRNFENRNDLENKINQFDILHVCGGNTLYLNYLFHKSGLFEIAQNLVKSERLIYTGTSAGSMIVAPDLFGLKDSLMEEMETKYLEGITRNNYFGLNLVPFLIIPHTQNPDYINDNKKIVEKLSNYPCPTIWLKDNQAIWVEDNKFQIINN